MVEVSSKPFSISFGSSKPKSSTTPINPKKRPHSALVDPDSDHEGQAEPQVITGFDQSTGGAISVSATPSKSPLIIPSQKNRDWREESRRKGGKNLLPTEVQAVRNGLHFSNKNVTVERDETSLEAGLKFVDRYAEKDISTVDGEPSILSAEERPEREQTADEEAMELLLSKERKSTLVIPTTQLSSERATTNGHMESIDHMNEDDRFRADVASRPDVASLDDYERIPVEDFGSAMLRGMGWKEGQAIGKAGGKAVKQQKVERRPALLGIGAKEAPGSGLDELGSWGKAAKGRRKTDLVYNPIILKNAKTGEMLTEEELETKKLEQERIKHDEDRRDRRDRNMAIDSEKKRRLTLKDDSDGGYRRRKRSRSRERRSHRDSRRDRSRSSERNSYSSRRNRSRSVDKDRYKYSARERSKSRERQHERRRYDHHDRKDRDYERDYVDYRRR